MDEVMEKTIQSRPGGLVEITVPFGSAEFDYDDDILDVLYPEGFTEGLVNQIKQNRE